MGELAVAITKLKKQLLERVDIDDLNQVEKVERYIDLVKSFRRMNARINKDGEIVVTENATQRFEKAHPLITERNKLNSQLLALMKEIEKDIAAEAKKNEKDKGYSASDLV